MYCPTNVSTKGFAKDVSGKNKTGIKVNNKWAIAITITVLSLKLKTKHSPIPTSKMANSIILILSGINPNVKKVIVCFAKLSAGLKAGKNFKAPNHRYIIPMVIAKNLFLSIFDNIRDILYLF